MLQDFFFFQQTTCGDRSPYKVVFRVGNQNAECEKQQQHIPGIHLFIVLFLAFVDLASFLRCPNTGITSSGNAAAYLYKSISWHGLVVGGGGRVDDVTHGR